MWELTLQIEETNVKPRKTSDVSSSQVGRNSGVKDVSFGLFWLCFKSLVKVRGGSALGILSMRGHGKPTSLHGFLLNAASASSRPFSRICGSEGALQRLFRIQ